LRIGLRLHTVGFGAWGIRVMGHAGYFEPVAREAACDYCAGRRGATTLDLDAVYCISLQEQGHRAAAAAAHFHAVGLCRTVVFYRPVRGRHANRAIWESHRTVAQHATANGFTRVLVLEDDVFLTQPPERLVARLAAALRAVPADWWGLYLGHVPVQAYFVRPNLLRVRSGCTHAYVANAPLLAWLAATSPLGAPMWRRIGQSIDAAMSSLPGMYAMFPMIAVQRFLGDYRVDTRFDDQGRRRGLLDVDRWRYVFIFAGGARFAEAMAVLLSPLHRLTLEWGCRRLAEGRRSGVADRALDGVEEAPVRVTD